MAAAQFRLLEWAAQIRDCQSRPDGMGVVQWCNQHGITKANYYYRLRRVREVRLRSLPQEALSQPIVPFAAEMLHPLGPVSAAFFQPPWNRTMKSTFQKPARPLLRSEMCIRDRYWRTAPSAIPGNSPVPPFPPASPGGY